MSITLSTQSLFIFGKQQRMKIIVFFAN